MSSTADVLIHSLDADLSSTALVFPNGLIGCPEWKRFVLLSDDQEELPVAYLQSLDVPEVRLLVSDPRLIINSYAAPLSETDRAHLGLSSGGEVVLYCTLSVGSDGMITANLLGPLVVNSRTRIGRQLVLTESGYTTRYPVAKLHLGA
jgi:flagellar assembly factor FliW